MRAKRHVLLNAIQKETVHITFGLVTKDAVCKQVAVKQWGDTQTLLHSYARKVYIAKDYWSLPLVFALCITGQLLISG